MRLSRFERDVKTAQEVFPKLSIKSSSPEGWKIGGEIDVCDADGNYWDTFLIEVLFTKMYPHCVPLLFETGGKIQRHIDYHIDGDGLCCVDITHKLLYRSKRGLSVMNYLREWVYPYLANQVYRGTGSTYAGGEYGHHFAGVRQFYTEDLKLSVEKAEEVLRAIVQKRDVGRNAKCPCGSGEKVKRCHEESILFLKTLDRKLLESDLEKFSDLNTADDEVKPTPLPGITNSAYDCPGLKIL